MPPIADIYEIGISACVCGIVLTICWEAFKAGINIGLNMPPDDDSWD